MRQQRVQDNIYVFDPETGNLSSRRNDLRNRTESFEYDELNRLTKIKFNDVLDREYKYQTNGNIDTISGIGKLSYDAIKIHAVNGFYNTDSFSFGESQDLDYTPYNKVKLISQENETKKLEFLYGADQQRRRTIYTNNGQQKTTWFIGNYEKEQTGSATRELHYINGADGLAAVYIKENGTGALYYILKDHLGSIQYICSESGQKLEEFDYDAWGLRRDPATLSYTNLSFSSYLTRGFTGHEHLDEFSIINMNGRIYDPNLGRMLSPDPYVQMPDFSQSLNRYSYCVNNPLKFVDPTGYTWWSNFKKWSKKSFNNLGAWWSDNNLPMIGLNINGDGVLAYAGVPVADGTNVSVGYNFTSDQWGIGNNVGGFSNFYYPEYNYDGLGQNVLREYNGERQAYNDVWRGGASSQGGGKSTFDKINYLAGLKVTGASAYYSAKLNRWSMYRPLESSILSLRGSSKYMSAIKGVNVAKGFGVGLTGVGIVYDYTIGVPRYNKGIRDEWSVSPQKAGLNTGVALYSLTINPAVGILYFGIDAFYPSGLGGYMNDTDRIIQRNQEILGSGWNMYRMEGGLK